MSLLFTLEIPEGLELSQNDLSDVNNLPSRSIILQTVVDESDPETQLDITNYSCNWYLIDIPTQSTASISIAQENLTHKRNISLDPIDKWGTYRLFCVVFETSTPETTSEINPLKAREQHFVNISVLSKNNQLEKPAYHQRNWREKYDKLVNVVENDNKKIKIINTGSKSFTLPVSDGSSGQFLKTDGLGVLSFSGISLQDVDIENLSLNNLSDVDTAGVAGGKALIYDSNDGQWKPGDVAAPDTTTLETNLITATGADNEIKITNIHDDGTSSGKLVNVGIINEPQSDVIFDVCEVDDLSSETSRTGLRIHYDGSGGANEIYFRSLKELGSAENALNLSNNFLYSTSDSDYVRLRSFNSDTNVSSGMILLNSMNTPTITIDSDALVLNGTVSGTAIKDEDDMTSDSASHLATQQSIKAYVDTAISGVGGGSFDLNSDTAPQLGGNLDLNGYSIKNLGSNPSNNINFATDNYVWFQKEDGTFYLSVQDSSVEGSNTRIAELSSQGGMTLKAISDINVSTANSGGDINFTMGNTGGGVIHLQVGTNTLTLANNSISGEAILNDDTMTSNSANHLATQQSIKAYVDNAISGVGGGGGGGGATNSITENNAKVEVFDDNSAGAAVIKFSVDPSNSGTPTEVWNINGSGHLIPQTNATYDIGSAEKKVRHFYLSDNSLKFLSGSSENSDLVEYRLGRTEKGELSWETYSLGDNPEANPDTPTSSQKLSYKLDFDDVRVVSTDSSDIGLSKFGELTYDSNDLTISGIVQYESSFIVDGIELSLNDRVLVLGRTNNTENGIYKLTQVGSPPDFDMMGGSPWVFTRTDDFVSTNITKSKKVYVLEGNTYSAYSFAYSGNNNPTIDTNDISFVNQFSKFEKIKERNSDILVSDGSIIRPDDSSTVDLGEFANPFDDLYSNTAHFKQQLKLNTGSNEYTIDSIKDEDDMSSDSASSLATQQSIKAYVDNKIPAIAYISATINTDNSSKDTIGAIDPFNTSLNNLTISSSNITLSTNVFQFDITGTYEIDYTFIVNNFYGDPNITLEHCSLSRQTSPYINENITEIASLNNVILPTSGEKQNRCIKLIQDFNANDRLIIKLGGPSSGNDANGGVEIYAGTSIIIKKIG